MYLTVPKATHQPRLRYDRDNVDPSTASPSGPPSGDGRFVLLPRPTERSRQRWPTSYTRFPSCLSCWPPVCFSYVAALARVVHGVKFCRANAYDRLTSSVSHPSQMAATYSDTGLCLLASSELLRRRYGGWVLVRRLRPLGKCRRGRFARGARCDGQERGSAHHAE